MITFVRTPEFDSWLKALRDPIGKARIISRIRSAEQGNFVIVSRLATVSRK